MNADRDVATRQGRPSLERSTSGAIKPYYHLGGGRTHSLRAHQPDASAARDVLPVAVRADAHVLEASVDCERDDHGVGAEALGNAMRADDVRTG
jgi:hypothetical protein